MYSNQSEGLAGLANGMSPEIGQAEEFYSKKVAEEGADPNDMTAFLSKIYKVTQDPNLIGAIVNRHMAKQLAASMAPPGAQPSPPTVADKIKLDLMNLKKAKEQKNKQAQADLESALTGQDASGGGEGEAPPEGGEEAPPEGGEEAPPEGGEEAPPEGGEEAPPEGGEEAPPEGGEEAPPEGGEMEQGIGSIDAGSMEAPQTMNTGGIVAFAAGGAPHLAAEAEEAAYLNSPDIEERIAQAEAAADRGDMKAKSWLSKTRALINSGKYGRSVGSASSLSPAVKKWATTGAKFARGIATPIAIAGTAGDIYSEVTDPNATAGEKALRVARTTGRLAAQGIGAEIGTGLSAFTGPLAPIAAPVLGIGGGWLAGKAYDLLGSEEKDKAKATTPTVEDIQKSRMIEEATKLDAKSGNTPTTGKTSGSSGGGGSFSAPTYSSGSGTLSTKGIDDAFNMKKDELERRQKEIMDRPNKPRTLGSIPEEYEYQKKMVARANEELQGAKTRNAYEHAADMIAAGGRGRNIVAATGDALKASVQRSNQYHKDYLDAMDKADQKYVEYKKADAKAKETDDQNDYATAEAKKTEYHQARMDVATAKELAEKAKVDIEDKNISNSIAMQNANSNSISANASLISAKASAARASANSSGATLDLNTKKAIMTNYTKLLEGLQINPAYMKASPTNKKLMEDKLYNSVAERFGVSGSSDADIDYGSLK